MYDFGPILPRLIELPTSLRLLILGPERIVNTMEFDLTIIRRVQSLRPTSVYTCSYTRLQNRFPPATLKNNIEHRPCQPVLALTRARLSFQVFYQFTIVTCKVGFVLTVACKISLAYRLAADRPDRLSNRQCPTAPKISWQYL